MTCDPNGRGPDSRTKGDSNAMSDEMVQQALRLGTRGWRVFPCEEHGKKPLVAKWPQRAACDPAEIRALWLTNPSANIGIATGDISGIFVLDVDGQKGADSLLEWDSGGQRLPDTLRAKTGSGWAFLLCTAQRRESSQLSVEARARSRCARARRLCHRGAVGPGVGTQVCVFRSRGHASVPTRVNLAK
jgi:hypothetical protein